MNVQTTEKAFAKINLTLDVLGRRPDGYHDLRSVMQSVSLADTLTVRLTNGSGKVRVRCPGADLPPDGENLAGKAVLAWMKAANETAADAEVEIIKRIPVCAGLGGGSSDAAAALRAVNRLFGAPMSAEELRRIGASVGSDVPFCVTGGTALAEGRGERLCPLRLSGPLHFVLVKPAFSVRTPELFRRLDEADAPRTNDTERLLKALADGSGVAACLGNAFLRVLCEPQIRQILDRLLSLGAEGSSLSGSGPTLYGLYPDRDAAIRAAAALRAEGLEAYAATDEDPCVI